MSGFRERCGGALGGKRLGERFAGLLTVPAKEEPASLPFHQHFMGEEVDRWHLTIQAARIDAD